MGLVYKGCLITIVGDEVRVEPPTIMTRPQPIVHVMWRGVGLGQPKPSIGDGIKEAVDHIDTLQLKRRPDVTITEADVKLDKVLGYARMVQEAYCFQGSDIDVNRVCNGIITLITTGKAP